MRTNRSLVALLIVACAICFEPLRAAEITGTIRDVSGSVVTVAPQGDLAPNVGDKAEVFFKLAGMDEEISVAAGSVAKVERDSIHLKIDNATGEVAKDQLVRITSEKPQPRATLAAATTSPASAAAGSAKAGPGRDPSFAFVDMNKLFRDSPKTKEAEAQINATKNAAKKEYDERVARKEPASEIDAWRKERENALQEQSQKARAEIVSEIKSSIDSSAGAGVNVVLDASGSTLNGVPLFLFTPAATPVQPAKSLKIALVNMSDVFQRFSKTRTAEEEVNAARAAAKKIYDQRMEVYQKELAKVEKLTKSAREKQTTKVNSLGREINDWKTAQEQELQADAVKKRTAIVTEITEVVGGKIRSAGQVMVIDRSGRSLNGLPEMIFHRELPDLSDEIVAALNDSGSTGPTTTALPSSDSLRFGLVDLDRTFQAMPETKRAEAEINQAKNRANAETAGADAATRTQKEKELQELSAKKRQEIVDKIKSAIDDLAQSSGYNVLFDSSGKSQNGVPFVLKSHDLPDLTDELIVRLK